MRAYSFVPQYEYGKFKLCIFTAAAKMCILVGPILWISPHPTSVLARFTFQPTQQI